MHSLHNFYRAMLCIRGTSHGPVSVSVCLCLSQVGVLLQRLNVGSHKQDHMIAQGSSFLMQNSTRVTPYGGAKCRWGGSKSATFVYPFNCLIIAMYVYHLRLYCILFREF